MSDGDNLLVLREAITRDIDVDTATFPGGYPGNIELALLDAVLSIRAKYGTWPTTGVGRRVMAYRELRASSQAGEVICDDLAVLADFDRDSLGDVVGRQEVSGVPKVDVIQNGARALADAGARHTADLKANPEDYKSAYTSVRGLGPVTWSYFGMLLGIQDVKADTMIRRYLSRQLGRTVNSDEARGLLLRAAEDLGLEPSALDHAIWRFERRAKPRKERSQS